MAAGQEEEEGSATGVLVGQEEGEEGRKEGEGLHGGIHVLQRFFKGNPDPIRLVANYCILGNVGINRFRAVCSGRQF